MTKGEIVDTELSLMSRKKAHCSTYNNYTQPNKGKSMQRRVKEPMYWDDYIERSNWEELN